MFHLFRQGLGMGHRRPVLLTILGIGLFYGVYSEGFDRLWIKQLLDFSFPWGMQPLVWFSLLRAVGALFSIAGAEVIRCKMDVARSQRAAQILASATALLVLGLIGFAWSPGLLIASCMVIVIGVMRSIIEPVYTAWVN